MRVIGGEFRSRRLRSAPGRATRPTPDRLREALFNVLAPRISGCTFVDAYAGSGAVGIEALSRGAAHVVFIERSRAALRFLEENLRSLDLSRRSKVICGSSLRHLGRLQADIVFLDPPYEMEKEYGRALRLLSAAPPELVVVQHSARLELAECYGPLRSTRRLVQGDNVLSFFEPAGPG